MFHKKFERLLRLARNTNTPLIVTDPEAEEPFVLMSLDQYEDLAAEFDPREFEESIDSDWEEQPESAALYGEELDKNIEIDEIATPEDELFTGEINEEMPPFETAPSASSNSEERFYLEPIE